MFVYHVHSDTQKKQTHSCYETTESYTTCHICRFLDLEISQALWNCPRFRNGVVVSTYSQNKYNMFI